MARTTKQQQARETLGRHVLARRTALGMSQQQLAERAHMVRRTVGSVERGDWQGATLHESTKYNLEAALGWVVGACDAVMRGEEPALSTSPRPTVNVDNDDLVFVYRALNNADPELLRRVRLVIEAARTDSD